MEVLSNNEVSEIIDKHLKNTNPKELPLKGLYFGQLWFKAGSYSKAAEWITKYLRVHDRDAKAHKLLGDCFEKLGDNEKALSCFKQSTTIKPNQHVLILHIVELHLNPGPAQNPNIAQVWLDKVSAALPGNQSVFKMKMELLLAQQASPKVLETALLQEISKRPGDSDIHIQYVSFMKAQDRLDDAYAYCDNIDNSQGYDNIVLDSKWCLCVMETYKEYIEMMKQKGLSNHLAVSQILLLEAVTRCIQLNIQAKQQSHCLQQFTIMDETLWLVVCEGLEGNWKVVVDEMVAQLAWIATTLLLQQAEKKKCSWSDARRLATILYAFSLTKPIPPHTSSWVVGCSSAHPKLPDRLMERAAVRKNECSHMLWALCGEDGDDWLTKVQQEVNVDKAGKNVFDLIFGKNVPNNLSYLYNGKEICSANAVQFILPSLDDMAHFEQLATVSGDLQMYIWLGLRCLEIGDTQDYFLWFPSAFPDLKISSGVSNLYRANASSLNLIDIESFVAACVFTTEQKSQAWRNPVANSADFMSCVDLPLALCRKMTTEIQDKWWNAALTISGKKPSLNGTRQFELVNLLQQGLDCLRGIGNHGLDCILITKLANYFTSKASTLKIESGVTATFMVNQKRAALYWGVAIPHLVDIWNNRTAKVKESKNPFFPSVFSEPSQEQAEELLIEAYMCHGELAAHENRFDEAISFYGKANTPQASFIQAHLFQQMANKLNDGSKKVVVPLKSVEQQIQQYMKKYRHALELTLVRLTDKPDDELYDRTMRLLSSPIKKTPPRKSANITANNTIPIPSKQSTPKNLSTSVIAANDQSAGESESIVNELTNTISSMKIQIEQLQEQSENMRQDMMMQNSQYSHSYFHNSSVMPQMQTPNMMMSSTRMMSPGYGMRPINTMPQRPMVPGVRTNYVQDGLGSPQIGATPISMTDQQLMQQQLYQQRQILQQQKQLQHIQQFQQQNQGYYSPKPQTTAYFNNQQSYNSLPMGGSPMNPGLQMGASQLQGTPDMYRTPVIPQQVLQHRMPHMQQDGYKNPSEQMSQILATPVSRYSSPVPQQPIPVPKMLFSQNVQSPQPKLTMTPTSISEPLPPQTSQTNHLTKPAAVANSPLIQKLLSDPKTTSTSSTPTFQFLSQFTSPKCAAPGEFTFKSPEQMDKENHELDILEQEDNDQSGSAYTGPYFEPIVSLPDLVEVKTGEENEEVLFQERSKLFRFVGKEWKERGLGEMKVLRHKMSGSVRVLMRREQVHKICCNHMVTSRTKLSLMPNSNKAVIWSGLDFSEGQQKMEQFCARFKTPELATKFLETVNKEAENIGTTESAPASTVESKAKNTTIKSEVANTKTNPSMFATNSSMTLSSSITNAASTFKLEPSLKFGATPKADSTVEDKPKPSIFTGLATAMKSSGLGQQEGGNDQFRFSFGKPTPKPANVPGEEGDTGPHKEDHQDEDLNASSNQEGGAHFEPIVELPALVKVETGEEDEEVKFCERAKLYRYADGQWKERGLGEMKILEHKTNGSSRVIMRREQVLKLCANHRITPEMKLQAHGNTAKAWMWTAMDFSEDELENQVFSVKFKTPEQAGDFKIKFEEAANKKTSIVKKSEEIKQPSSPAKAAMSYLEQQKKSPDETKQPSLLQNLLQQAANSWDCTECYASNPKSSTNCLCCDAANPSVPKRDSEPKPSTTGSSGFKFGMQATDSKPPTYKFGVQMTAPANTKPPAEANTISFGLPGTEKPLFGSGASSQPTPLSSFSFGMKPSSNANSNQKPLFGLTTSTSEPTSSKPPIFGTKPATSEPVKPSLAQLAQQQSEQWECPGCCVKNKPDVNTCPCCATANPNAKQQETRAEKPLFGSGVSSQPTPLSSFSFGMKPSSNANSNQKPLFGLTTSTSEPTSSKPPIFGTKPATSEPVKPSLAQLAQQQSEQWECPGCCVKNKPDVNTCPCCATANPNAKQQETKTETKPSFGFGMNSQTSSSFSFGVKQPTSTDSASTDKAPVHQVLQRAGGLHNQQPSGFSFKLNNANSSSNVKPFSFGVTPGNENIFAKPDAKQPGEKTRFPSIGNGDEETDTSSSDDDSDDSYVTYDEDEEGEYNSDEHQHDESDDVICLGEKLPSKEHQEEARKLRLPLNFFSYKEEPGFVESEEEEDTDNSEIIPPKIKTEIKPVASKSGFTFGGATGVKSFTQLAQDNLVGGFSFSVASKPAAPTTKPIKSESDVDKINESNELYQTEERDNIHVDPVLKELPPNIQVITGEEGEQTMYSHRAKLFRFADQQWKEKGLGDIAIKYNMDSNRFRVVMRREQVLKVCANHYIDASMKLIPMSGGSKNTWTWIAPDFSEGGSEPVVETLAVKFKTPEIADQFKEKFEECQFLLSSDHKPAAGNDLSTSTIINQAEKMKSELGFFKDKLSMKSKVDLEHTFTEGLDSKESSKFEVGDMKLTPLVKQHQVDKEKSQNKSVEKPVLEWNKKSESEEIKEVITKKESTEVPSIGLSKFQFSMKPDISNIGQSKPRGISICSATSDESQDIHFEPIVDLPDRVKVLTGEENDQVLFLARSKLYVFAHSTKEWKERGLGEVKLLQNTKSFKIRIVMRREQVLKVCLNHYISPEIEFNFKEKSDKKVLVWCATDYSNQDQPSGEPNQFALRFKVSEIADLFLSTLDRGREAALDGKLIDPSSISFNESYATAGDTSAVSNQTEGTPVMQSPVKLPTKTPFSFANMESPFQEKDSKSSGFVFGDAPKSKPTTKFNFEVGSFSFQFNNTSTPATADFKTPLVLDKALEKPVASKSLFGGASRTNTLPFATPSSNQQTGGFSFKPKTTSAPAFQFGQNNAATNLFGVNQNTKPNDNGSKPQPPVDDDVIFVWEAKPTSRQLERAQKLKLPNNFFLYEDKEDCNDGYNSEYEDFVLEYIFNRDNEPEEEYKPEHYQSDTLPEEEPHISPEPSPEPEVEKPSFSLFGNGSTAPKNEYLFQSFAENSNLVSFSDMAADNKDNKNSFGFRKDAAFNVSSTDRMLFGGQSSGQNNEGAEEYDPQYQPVLSELPSLVEVKTGEEDEEVLFKERCKLYRFDNSAAAWKERGLGEMKILHHIENSTHRIVMRREQVLKVCANHLITRDMSLVPNGEKCWMYVAQDQSGIALRLTELTNLNIPWRDPCQFTAMRILICDSQLYKVLALVAGGEAVVEKFTVRFKTPEIAEKFRQVWTDTQC